MSRPTFRKDSLSRGLHDVPAVVFALRGKLYMERGHRETAGAGARLEVRSQTARLGALIPAGLPLWPGVARKAHVLT